MTQLTDPRMLAPAIITTQADRKFLRQLGAVRFAREFPGGFLAGDTRITRKVARRMLDQRLAEILPIAGRKFLRLTPGGVSLLETLPAPRTNRPRFLTSSRDAADPRRD